ncbi:unnamed protein product, partial [Closterium sp. NIES-64]
PLASICGGAPSRPAGLQSPLPLPARHQANPPAPRPGMVCPAADAGTEGGGNNAAARALAAASHGVCCHCYSRPRGTCGDKPQFRPHDIQFDKGYLLPPARGGTPNISSHVSLRGASGFLPAHSRETILPPLHRPSLRHHCQHHHPHSLLSPTLDSSSSSSATVGGGWGGVGGAGGGRGGHGVEGRTSGGELSDYAYGDATSDAKGRAARAAFRRQLAAEELQHGLEEEGFVEEMRASHTAFTASLRAATAAIASALRDHPLLLSLHLALSAVVKGLP